MNEIRDLIVGIDFREDTTQICYYDRKAEEPLSLSVKAGSEIYESPTLLTRRPQGDYVVGVEADYFAAEKGGERIDDIYGISGKDPESSIVCGGEEKYPWELTAAYLRGVLRFLGIMDLPKNTRCIGIAVEKLNVNRIRNLKRAMHILGYREEQYLFIDQEEAFYYYVMSQKREILNRSIAWYIFDENHVTMRKMTVNGNIRPAAVRLESETPAVDLPEDGRERDRAFDSFVERTLGKEMFANIQISGNGFSQDWAQESVKRLCYQRRKVYYGNNLFARGACSAGKERTEDHRLKGYRFRSAALVEKDVGMEMRVMGSPAYHPLIEGGRNWYEYDISCELILDGKDHLEFLVTSPGESERKRVKMELPGLPERPNRTTRLALSFQYISAAQCVVTVKDLGFGEMFVSSGKIWKETVEW